jgi:hypothetical protein
MRRMTDYGTASGAGWDDRCRPNSGHRSDIAACRRSAIALTRSAGGERVVVQAFRMAGRARELLLVRRSKS